MVKIEIDGKTLSVAPGSMIIEAADDAGIYIPRFCYHKKLSIAANCRMCLVQIENVRKPMPACATPVTDGMKVLTQSAMAKESQNAVMEFLLINHPLDCPICDQGGQCELQDLSMIAGRDHSHFVERKRVVADENLGPLVETEMTRCIHCTRCVRFGDEIAGLREMGGTARGEHMKIGTYVQGVLQSELSGNIIDLCPVGALTSKPFRFSARAWELSQSDAISPHDALGSHLHIHTRNHKVMRVVPKAEESINETWLSDRDRFSYTALDSHDRLTQPMLNDNGTWNSISWTEALNIVVTRWQALQQQFGGDAFASIISPSSTIEEMYLLQKIMRLLGSSHIDHRLRQRDFSDDAQQPIAPTMALSLQDIEKQSSVFLIGSHLAHEQPLLAHRVRKMQNAKIFSLNPMHWSLHCPIDHDCVVSPAKLPYVLAEISKAISEIKKIEIPPLWKNTLNHIAISASAKLMAEQLVAQSSCVLLLGAHALQHPQSAAIKAMAQWIAAQLTDSHCVLLTDGANSAGAWYAGCVPHRMPGGKAVSHPGLNAGSMWQTPVKAYCLWQVEPIFDCADPNLVREALRQAEFVVAFTTFMDDDLKAVADLLLPIAAFTENEGTFVNLEDRWQSFSASVKNKTDIKPGWKVLRVLGNELGFADFDFDDVKAVRTALQQEITRFNFQKNTAYAALVLPQQNEGIERIIEWPLYRIDALVRRATPLQDWDKSVSGPVVKISQVLAGKLSLTDGQRVRVQQQNTEITLTIKIDNTVAKDCVWVPAGYPETASLNALFNLVEIAGA